MLLALSGLQPAAAQLFSEPPRLLLAPYFVALEFPGDAKQDMRINLLNQIQFIYVVFLWN